MPGPVDAAQLVRGWQLARRGVRTMRKTPAHEWRAQVRRLPVRPDVVLYESYYGKGALCHPEALFRYLVAAPDLAHLRHVWVLDSQARHHPIRAEFAGHPRVTFVRHRSASYFRHLATAGWLVNNSTFPPEFGKRPGQVYVNTWHGIPLKVMGYDEPSAIASTRNVVRNFLQADYLLSSSPYMTETMYASAYRLRNVYRGKIIEEGQPRIDRQWLDGAARHAVKDRLRAAGVAITDEDHLVLMAPTWQGSSFIDPVDDALGLGARVEELTALLPPGHRVLLKVHQQVYAGASAHASLRPFLVPNDLPTNELLGITDAMVSDYSSIFFDFLATGRPIVFFTPDRERYATERGLYFGPEELPGPSTRTVPDLARILSAIGTGADDDPLVTHAAAYRAAVSRFVPMDDGAASERIVDVVWRGRTEGRAVFPLEPDGRQTMLVYLGGMSPNGITTSALSLLASIDHERFDVSALYDYSGQPAKRGNAELIPAEVRRLARVGGFSPGKEHMFRRRRLLKRAARMTSDDLRSMLKLLGSERRRVLGDTVFDHVVDFSGYSPFWSFLMADVPARTHSIWMHNDLLADQMREIDGHRPHETNLGSVFASYRFFDHLVSVSEALRDINRNHLGAYAPPEKFGFARNAVDVHRVRTGVTGDPALVATWPGDHLFEPVLLDEPPTARSLALGHQVPAFEPEIDRRLAIALSPRREGVHQFVAVGRLSPEKNHERLIRAFAQVHAADPATRLVIIGDGPLAADLTRLAQELGLEDAVVFAGLLANPWALMAECDTFVLSSDYEGQPMVILEARALGLPVVTTAFGSVGSSVHEGEGLIVARDVDALAEGMSVALRGEVPFREFDERAYNAEVTEEFYLAIGVDAVRDDARQVKQPTRVVG
jgi:CDP-glycerol glycerophosphotransferase